MAGKLPRRALIGIDSAARGRLASAAVSPAMANKTPAEWLTRPGDSDDTRKEIAELLARGSV
jgi:hypothetical protein